MEERHTVILGGGVAGCACAFMLSKQGVNVTLLRLSAVSAKRMSVGEHLPPEGRSLLSRVGPQLFRGDSQHRESAGVLSYWGEAEAIQRHYLFNPLGAGLNLDRSAFDKALLVAVRKAGVNVVDCEQVSGISQTSAEFQINIIKMGASQTIRATFLVDATGRAAVASRQCGSRIKRHDKLVGLYGYFENVTCPDGRLLIEALEDGWWYSAPLSDNRMIAVYMTDSDLIPKGAAARQTYWNNRLKASKATWSRIERNAAPTVFQIVDAATQNLSNPCGENWIAIGDAAMAFDPISSAGMTKAFSNGLETAEIISKHDRGLRFDAHSYREESRCRFREYQKTAMSNYAEVTRFSRFPFWQRRQSIPY